VRIADGAHEADDIDSVMLAELTIFRGDERLADGRRKLDQPGPGAGFRPDLAEQSPSAVAHHRSEPRSNDCDVGACLRSRNGRSAHQPQS